MSPCSLNAPLLRCGACGTSPPCVQCLSAPTEACLCRRSAMWSRSVGPRAASTCLPPLESWHHVLPGWQRARLRACLAACLAARPACLPGSLPTHLPPACPPAYLPAWAPASCPRCPGMHAAPIFRRRPVARLPCLCPALCPAASTVQGPGRQQQSPLNTPPPSGPLPALPPTRRPWAPASACSSCWTACHTWRRVAGSSPRGLRRGGSCGWRRCALPIPRAPAPGCCRTSACM